MSNSTNKLIPDPVTLKAQSTATNPAHSAWVSANAGSGKTFVLARRVIRLMLQGTSPSQILCLTFTKAAASEMSNRVFSTLSGWTIMTDDTLAQEIEPVIGKKPDAAMLHRARQLFALSLDTPGGLKIQTIHAFCDALLHQFPLEANVPANFDQIDTPQQTALLEEAKRTIILSSLGKKGLPDEKVTVLAEAFATIRTHASDKAIDESLQEIINIREAFSRWTIKGLESAMEGLRESFQLSRETGIEEIAQEANSETGFTDKDWKELVKQARIDDGKQLKAWASAVSAMLSARSSLEKLKLREALFFTGEAGERKQRAYLGAKLFTDNIVGRDKFDREAEMIKAQYDRIKTAEALHASEALFTIAKAVLSEYANLKQRHSYLDFNDLIQKAAGLLNRNEARAWVQYKLDKGIDHILVDEAQDTSPLQWEIINAITEEFFSGKGSRNDARTQFVVGDKKQSIYSFQGADPEEFDRQQRLLKTRATHSHKPYAPVTLSLSFRSCEEILSSVDQVFSLEENRRGLGDIPPHTSIRAAHRGDVIIWPLVRQPEKPKQTDWFDPPDKTAENAAEIVLAKRIAGEIGNWLKQGAKLHGRDRKIRAGDILILVRKRNRFATAITRELKAAGLPTAGADRLKLAEHIAVEDMMAMGRFAMMQGDDLALASILKSPLFDFSEEELFQVCHGHGKTSLFSHMKELKPADTALAEKLEQGIGILDRILRDAQKMPVYEFYGSLFSRHDLRRKYLARLGSEVEEVIDGFLQAAIEHDVQAASGITDFIEWLGNANPEIKREIDLKTDEIRVITAHSSKGLEAPIVFLVDPGAKAFDTRFLPKIAVVKDSLGNAGYLWQAAKEKRVEAGRIYFDSVEKAAEEEYRRLLYVGMTRAEDRLIICGYGQNKEIKHEHWHSMVMKGLKAAAPENGYVLEASETLDEEDEPVAWHWRNTKKQIADLPLIEHDEARQSVLQEDADWIKQKLRSEPQPPRPLTPSGVLQLLEIDTGQHDVMGDGSSLALEFGSAVHRLLQIIPDLAGDRREEAVSAFFSNFASGLDREVQEDIRNTVNKVLQAPAMQLLFGENSMAEVPLCGEVTIGTKTHLVRGQIDRLVVTGEKVIIADYKTNRLVPHDAGGIPAEYVAQLALYRELLAGIYPGKTIETKLVWTRNAVVMDVPEAFLDEQLQLLNQNRETES